METPKIHINEDIIDLAYERIAGAIPNGTNRGEALFASCRLVGDILAQISGARYDSDLVSAAEGFIIGEYKRFMTISER